MLPTALPNAAQHDPPKARDCAKTEIRMNFRTVKSRDTNSGFCPRHTQRDRKMEFHLPQPAPTMPRPVSARTCRRPGSGYSHKGRAPQGMHLQIWFDNGGDFIWPFDWRASANFGAPVEPAALPLSSETMHALMQFTERFRSACAGDASDTTSADLRGAFWSLFPSLCYELAHAGIRVHLGKDIA